MGGYQRRYDNQPRGNPETDEGKEQKSGLIILQKSKDLMQYLYTYFSVPAVPGFTRAPVGRIAFQYVLSGAALTWERLALNEHTGKSRH